MSTSPGSLRLYDTMQREKVAFVPRDAGKASLYICGPTVQADPHIGHGRSQVVFDTLRRWLQYSGLDVTMACNITDVDDKIILRATRERVSSYQIATKYTRAWNEAMAALNILPPDIAPTATGHILEMQAMIQQLLDQDKAYEAEGNVLFRVRKFPGYGKLSGRKIDDMQAGEDLVATDIKQDPLDFAMWKAAKPGEPFWPSPWGDGRPGWHIECSAMASKHLGGGFDIHGGGFDLVFPHHENEITQYEAATGNTFANHWVHNGMLTIGEEKMSKSLGNIISLGEAIDQSGPGPLRLWFLSAHHRSPLVFDDEPVQDAIKTYERFQTFIVTATATLRSHAEAFGLSVEPFPLGGVGHEGAVAPNTDAATPFLDRFADAMNDDLNAPRAVAALHELVGEGFDRLKAVDTGDREAAADVLGLADALLDVADRVFGLRLGEAVDATWASAARIAPVVDDLLVRRAEARAAKDFAAADAIRDQLVALAVVVEDRPSGSRWYIDPSS
ncbi:MAG: cysteinyl-tRNA synthetase [Glaciecola sp.]|jgi:cysteinyl-tRNA synthetase